MPIIVGAPRSGTTLLRFMLDAQTEEIVGDDRVNAVRFKDGSEVPADLVVMAAGIRPNNALALKIGLRCANEGRGVRSRAGPRSG